jgi:hypothetical protein
MRLASTTPRRASQFLIQELFALTFVVGVWIGIWQQGEHTSAVLMAASIPLAGPGLVLWGSIFERRWVETIGAAMTLCVPVLLLAAALMPPLLALAR